MAEIMASEAEEGTTYTTNRGLAVLVLGTVEGSNDVRVRDIDTQRELSVPPSYPLILIPDEDSRGPAALVGLDRADLEPALVSLTVDQLHELLDLDQRLWAQAAVADAISARDGGQTAPVATGERLAAEMPPRNESPPFIQEASVAELTATGVEGRTTEVRRLTSQAACQATLDWYDADVARKLEAKVRTELERLIKWHGQLEVIATSKAKLTQAAKLKRYNDPLRPGILARIRRLLAELDGGAGSIPVTEEATAPAPAELAGPSMAGSLQAADRRVMESWLSARWHGPFDLETIEALTGGVRICRSAIALLRAQPRPDEADILIQAWAWARWGGGQEASDTVRDQIQARARAANVVIPAETPPHRATPVTTHGPLAPYDSLWVTVGPNPIGRRPGGVQALPNAGEVTIWCMGADGTRWVAHIDVATMSSADGSMKAERSGAVQDPTMGGLLTLHLSLKIALEWLELRPSKSDEARAELQRWTNWLVARPGYGGAQIEDDLRHVLHQLSAGSIAAASDRLRALRQHKLGADPSSWPESTRIEEPATQLMQYQSQIEEGDTVLLVVELNGEPTGDEWTGVVLDVANSLIEVSWVGYELGLDPQGTGKRLRRLFKVDTGERFCAPKENTGGRKLRLAGLVAKAGEPLALEHDAPSPQSTPAPEVPKGAAGVVPSREKQAESTSETRPKISRADAVMDKFDAEEEAALRILAESKKAGDARPAAYMRGLHGKAAEGDMNPIDVQLWSLGRVEFDEMVEAGVVVTAAALDPMPDFAAQVATSSMARALELVREATSRAVLRLAWQAEDAEGKRARVLDAIEARRNELRATEADPQPNGWGCKALVPANSAHAGKRCTKTEPHKMSGMHLYKGDDEGGATWEGQAYRSPSGSKPKKRVSLDSLEPMPSWGDDAREAAPVPEPETPAPAQAPAEVLVQPEHLKLVAKPDGTEDLYHCLPDVAPRYLGPADHPKLAPVVAQLRAMHAKTPPAPTVDHSALGALGDALAALQALGLKIEISITN